MKTKIYTLAFIILISVLISGQLISQNPGDLDLSFGVNGISSQSIPGNGLIYDISVLSDGKIISAGKTEMVPEDQNLLSYKYNLDGSLAYYAGGNWLEFQLGYDIELANGTCILPDDKILLSGFYYNTPDAIRFFVMRLFPDGTLDASFGVDGISTKLGLSFRSTGMTIYYGLSGAYNIYLSGYTIVGAEIFPAIIKLDSDGEMVNSFGTNGMYILSSYPNANLRDIYAYSFPGSGYLYTAGENIAETEFFISKHDLNTGDLVSSFGTNGIYSAAPPTGSQNYVSALVFRSTLSNNTIALFGDYQHNDGDRDIFAIRLNASDGTPDLGFGINGWSSLRLAGSNEYMYDAILQTDDGKYYFGGSSNYSDISDFMLGRLTSNGFLDTGFGNDGMVLTDINFNDYLLGLALSPDESRIYAGGNSITPTAKIPAMACYHTGIGVGISALESNDLEISVYPNPAIDHIYIHTGLEDNYLIKIFSPEGKLIMQERQVAKDLHINIQYLEKGIYILKLTSEHSFQSSKIIKQ